MEIIKHFISPNSTLKEALNCINIIDGALVLFVINEEGVVLGSLTDGDIRRGLLNSFSLTSKVTSVMNKNFKYFKYNSSNKFNHLKSIDLKIIPVLDNNNKIIKLVDITNKLGLLPIDAVIMAGGEGKRLRPLTKDTPKPMLIVGNKPILEHNIDRLGNYGIENIFISVNYLSDKITNYFGDGKSKDLNINYITEKTPLGTIGAVSQVEEFDSNIILIMNSDLLTNINFEKFYNTFIEYDSDMCIATIPYNYTIPYAVLNTNNENIINISEKPTYTYKSNAGIYLIKKEVLKLIPNSIHYNATDLIQLLIEKKLKVTFYDHKGYWLDIGSPEDFEKAQNDINHII